MDAAVNAGADAVGLVFYPSSPRCVDLAVAAALADRVPPFVTRVGLFVNAEPALVRRTLETVPLELLQFHGDEDEAYCSQFGKPYIRAARVRPGVDLLEFARVFSSARAVLLDTYAEGYGGSGKTFDWSLIPDRLPLPLILSGGLYSGNVAEAVRALSPWAVDVSSGVEAGPDKKGIKDAAKIEVFVAAVRAADGVGEA
ncbi:MAG: phosphoribosylanthranilate isomerase [Rhodocyclaceae bacterium]|nr:phosphoribosylanthranilate isomerase [Rhodocyclaceae bacterium]